jgi:hypothetical protein
MRRLEPAGIIRVWVGTVLALENDMNKYRRPDSHLIGPELKTNVSHKIALRKHWTLNVMFVRMYWDCDKTLVIYRLWRKPFESRCLWLHQSWMKPTKAQTKTGNSNSAKSVKQIKSWPNSGLATIICTQKVKTCRKPASSNLMWICQRREIGRSVHRRQTQPNPAMTSANRIG